MFNLDNTLLSTIRKEARKGNDRTIKRVLQHPGKGLDDLIIDFNLRHRLENINTIDRSIMQSYERETVKYYGTDVLAWMIDYYGINMDNLGSISLIANDGTFVEAINAAARNGTNFLLRDCMSEAYEVYLQAGGGPFDVFLIDTPGDNSSAMPLQAAYGADHVFFPFMSEQLGLLGVKESLTQVVGTLRSDGAMYKLWQQQVLLPPVPCKFNVHFEGVANAFINTNMVPMLKDFGLQVSGNRIEHSEILEFALPATTTAPEFGPMTNAVYSAFIYYDGIGVQP
jgi:hypothetical protein